MDNREYFAEELLYCQNMIQNYYGDWLSRENIADDTRERMEKGLKEYQHYYDEIIKGNMEIVYKIRCEVIIQEEQNRFWDLEKYKNEEIRRLEGIISETKSEKVCMMLVVIAAIIMSVYKIGLGG